MRLPWQQRLMPRTSLKPPQFAFSVIISIWQLLAVTTGNRSSTAPFITHALDAGKL